MRISVLSGKGGTGKTTVATNLSYYLSKKGEKVQYLDFDVEEPNGFIFLKPEIENTFEVKVKVPQIDESSCTQCGLCAKKCNFNALSVTKNGVLVFEKICHSCGLCSLVCPVNAITEVEREIGKIEIGYTDNLKVVRGILNIGEPMGIPILKDLKKLITPDYINIIDSPPGSSCSVVHSVEGSDYGILVTEPTKFGLHDLEIAVNVIRQLGVPFGVVINKSDENDYIIEEFCKKQGIDIIERIPFDRSIAQKYSKGELLDDKIFMEVFENIFSKIMEVSNNEADSCN
ncbi:(4Fe-4S)-binding protein [Caloranaerobacter azorensis H53214]|uniref:(4Fe-4S)-binding protein n=1 Tax=Caloranaerobacter azorensis H53214 TaxID=1156417 RepID=A0A096DMD5_9FIRM|nr:ATP-binding protein [Caloranaerobacter azorensis]KGG80451.1 (4Fe-4S)-binding protein [Caloranaerobacter azorensis H53214]